MPVDEQAIAKLAYQLWESRGRPPGSGEQDWLEAQAMLAAAEDPVEKPVAIERRAAAKRPAAGKRTAAKSDSTQGMNVSGVRIDAVPSDTAPKSSVAAPDTAEAVAERRKSKKTPAKRDSARSNPP